jgi:hypothetical protein
MILGQSKDVGRGLVLLLEPRRTVSVVLLLLSALASSARPLTESEVKSVFLLNFAKFIEWPPEAYSDARAPMVIGIVGEDPFGEALPRILKGQTAQGRNLEIRYFQPEEDFGACQIVVLSRSVSVQTPEILQRLRGRPVLTVSEKDDFPRQGGVIGFALVDKSVRFDINSKAAERAGLKPSSKLLAVARNVIK